MKLRFREWSDGWYFHAGKLESNRSHSLAKALAVYAPWHPFYPAATFGWVNRLSVYFAQVIDNKEEPCN
jgi:hypothetical protein